MKRHPLELTYDQSLRSKRRLEDYLVINEKMLTEEEINNIKSQIAALEEVVELTPKEHRIKQYQRWG